MKILTQEVFEGQPNNVDWVGVDYDGLMSFGHLTNPRYTHASERWRGFDLVGLRVENSGYIPLTSLKRNTLRERIAIGECVSPLTTDRCPVCVDSCEASHHKNEVNELKKIIES